MDAADVLAGRYRLVERLGEGGMSVVWRAHDEVLDRQVAVKLLSPRLLQDQDSRARIRAEAQAVAKLAHPNIAGVFDFGEQDDGTGKRVPYIVMELLSGETLAQRLEEGPLPVTDVLRICSHVATALGAAHEHGLVHRDVKPANVMVTANGTAKVVDFGVAAVVGDLTDRDAVLFGTPAYVAPERLSGGAVVAATDVYGLGVLLYRMLTGYMPWSADSTTQMLVAHMYVEPEPLPPLTGLPPEVVEACQACLSKEPEDRPDAAEVAEILAAAAASLAGTNIPPVPPRIRSGRAGSGSGRSGSGGWSTAARLRRRRGFAMIGAAIALVGVITATVVAVMVVQPGDSADRAAPASEGQGAQPAASVGVGGVGGTSRVPGGPSGATATGPGTGPRDPSVPAQTTPGQPPTTGPSTPGATITTQEPVFASHSSAGNSVTVECAGEVAKITNAVPGTGWAVNRIKPGPDEAVSVRFTSDIEDPFKITFRGKCDGGQPKFNLSND